MGTIMRYISANLFQNAL